MRRKARASSSPHNKPRFWGRHPVAAALANPERVIRKIWVTHEAKNDFDFPKDLQVNFAEVADLGRLVPNDGSRAGTWAFPDPFGTQPVEPLSLAETVLISRHLEVPEVLASLGRSALADLADPAVVHRRSTLDAQPSDQPFVVDVRV